MKDRTKYGTYLSSFLRIYIDTEQDLGQLDSEKLGDYERGVFAHEYTHFLQNITTSFGLLHAWSTYDRLRQYVATIQKHGSSEIEIPLSGPIADEQRKLLFVRKTMEGGYRVPDYMSDADTKIIGRQLQRDDEYSEIYPDRPDIFHLQLDLEDNRKMRGKYIFGELAVSETMAYLMELKHYKGDPAPQFPYRACQHFGKYMGTDLLENDEFLFALCDVSLLSGFPGVNFYKILEDIISKKFIPKTTEELFDYAIRFLYSIGCQVFEQFENNMNGAIHVIPQLLPHPDMEATKDWITYLLRMGFRIRKETPHLMINLYRAPELFKGYWHGIMKQFGNPSLHNKTPIRYFKAPYDRREIEHLIDPIHLLAIQEVRDTLIKGSCDCKLYEYCKNSKNGLKVDERCQTAPWERAKDSRTCAYGALWGLYGLSDKKVIKPDVKH